MINIDYNNVVIVLCVNIEKHTSLMCIQWSWPTCQLPYKSHMADSIIFKF